MRTLKPILLVAAIAALSLFATKAQTHATTTPKGYVIAEINVTDPETYKQYTAAVPGIAAKFGGKYIVRAGNIIPVEGPAPTSRFVVIEFPSLSDAKAFEDSPEYQAVAPIRRKASTGRIFLIEGAPAN